MSCGGARLRVLSTGGQRSDDPTRLVRARAHHRDGFHFPVPVLTPAEARGLRRRLEAVEAEHGGALRGEIRHKPHLLFTWLAELVRHPTILDAVEDVLGPNLLVWSTSFFIKEARDPAYVSWHQDATYWGLSAPDVLTAWVAFTDATVENGAMRMVPGSHAEQLEHRDTFAPHNLLSRGQEIAVEVDEARGVDEYHHFAPGQPPAADLAPEARAPRRPPVTSP